MPLAAAMLEQNAASYDRGNGLCTRAVPAPIAEMFVGGRPVVDAATNAEMVQGVDMSSGVAVHGEGRARVADMSIDFVAHMQWIVDLRAVRRVGHPELILRITPPPASWACRRSTRRRDHR